MLEQTELLCKDNSKYFNWKNLKKLIIREGIIICYSRVEEKRELFHD